MEISHAIQFVIYLLSIMLLIMLVVVLISGAAQKSRNFVIMIIASILWLLPQFFAQYFFFNKYSFSVELIKVSLLFAGIVALSLSNFIKEQIGNAKNILLTTLGFIGPLIGLLCLTPIDKLKLSISNNGIAFTTSSPLYLMITAVVFLDFIVAIIALNQEQKRKIKQKENAQAILSLKRALMVAVLINLVGLIFFAKDQWSQILTPVSLVFFAMLTYNSIFRHKLFDIRAYVARSIAYLASLLVMGVLYGAIPVLLTDILLPPNKSSAIARTIIQIAVVTVAVLTFRPLKLLFDKITNRLFFKDAYDPQLFLDKLNQVLVSTLDLKGLLNSTSAILNENLKSQFSCFVISGDNSQISRVVPESPQYLDGKAINQLLLKASAYKLVYREELKDNDSLESLLKENKTAILARLDTKQSHQQYPIGWLVLGEKNNGNAYSRQDIRVIKIIANELALGIQNSLSYEEISSFNATLQQRVNEATIKLRKANDKLRALDEAKDDFVSMASHQLRTPLTSVKGNISMVIDGDAGNITSVQKQLLDQAYSSSQRMVFLISDLLNVSRLKTGKFVIERTPIDLAKVVEEEVNQLIDTAKSRNLELKYEKPNHITQLMLDDAKTRQVIMNFIDNAIYYTPSGGKIDVVLSETSSAVECRVIDNGIGVPKHEQHHLFTKFYRAGNARKARPDGTGLGLFMAKKVIISEGGALIFETEEGKGSTFGFSFPKKSLEVA